MNTQDQTLISIKWPKEMLNAGVRPYTPFTPGLNSILTESTLRFDPDQCPTRDRVIKYSHIGYVISDDMAIAERRESMTTLAQHLKTPRPRRILQPARKRLATLRRWYRRRVKPAVRKWVDAYLAATKANGS